MNDFLSVAGLTCVGFAVIYSRMNAKLFHQAEKAEPDEGWSVLAYAAGESFTNTLICGVLMFLMLYSSFFIGGIVGIIPVTLLSVSCAKLVHQVIKYDKLTLYVSLSIARIGSAALSLSAASIFFSGNPYDAGSKYQSFGDASFYLAGITILLTLITTYQSWQESRKWKTEKLKVS